MDAIHFNVKQDWAIINRAAYIVIDLDGNKDVLSMWIGKVIEDLEPIYKGRGSLNWTTSRKSRAMSLHRNRSSCGYNTSLLSEQLLLNSKGTGCCFI